ncbi:hypothetical protein EUTSA_v10022455mg [Eutrema salsugineum]|uniref:Neprosin PEP catalytic domain-containing protein n=1 Tax=Eutrema salsugineum TaxID=72664 RepID=V4KPT7_EUTSA|nr:hypothetical protein EUTSA_v10022455mg [Eutrema salsugineum]
MDPSSLPPSELLAAVFSPPSGGGTSCSGAAMPLRGQKTSRNPRPSKWQLVVGVWCYAAEIGFWPWLKFRESSRNYVEWGGEVYSASLPSPKMGYGFFPIAKRKFDAYIKRISILNGNFQVDRQVKHLEEFSDNTRGYGVGGLLQSRMVDAGHVIYYGGPEKI